MKPSIKIRCADKYEAQKLCSMVLVKENTYIVSVLNIIRNEMIVSLKDGSAHSIVLHDTVEAERLAAHMQCVFDGTHYMSGAKIVHNSTVLLQLSNV